MNRDQVNEQLRQRGWPELGPTSSDRSAAAAEDDAADRPDPRRDDRPLDGPTPRERAHAELVRRGWAKPDR